MANLSKPFEAYQGNDDYIFVSYAHSDAQSVYPDFTYLKDAGFNIWYDEGISPGSRWTSELASAIENCSLFLAFVSPAAVESENCVNEIEFAVNRRRPMLVVQLDPLDAFAHHALGHAYAIMGQIDESLGALARGVELSPNDAMANGCYAMQLAASNRPEEAKNYIDHAMSISPEDPWQHRFALVRARAHFAAAEYEESENWATRSLQLRPNNGAFLHSVAAPALSDGIDRARERVDKAREVQPTVPLEAIEQSFLRNTDRDYVTRLIEGLKRAGFE